MENGSLMKVESIAEWEHSAVLLTCIQRKLGIENQYLCSFGAAALDRFYCSSF